MNKKIFFVSLFLAVMLGSVVGYASAVSYTYEVVIVGKDGNGDPIYKAFTDDPAFMMGSGFVRFWLRNGTECPPPHDDWSPNQPHLMLTDEGTGYWVAYYTFAGYGDEIVTVRAHFQGGFPCDKSEWSTCVTVPWFTSLPVALAGCVGVIGYLKKKGKISL